MANNSQPAYRAYTIVKRGEGKDDFWLPVGAAFAHEDGEGFNVILQALPIDGRVVLRVPKDDDAPSEPSRRERAKDDRRGNERRR